MVWYKIEVGGIVVGVWPREVLNVGLGSFGRGWERIRISRRGRVGCGEGGRGRYG